MKISIKRDGDEPVLVVQTETAGEAGVLNTFGLVLGKLTATIEHGSEYGAPRLEVRREATC